MISVSLFSRRIKDLIRRTTQLESVPWATTQRFVSRPRNLGTAISNGIEFDAKFQLSELMANAIPLAWGLGFAGILALLGILCSLATTRLRGVAAGVAGAAAVAAFALPLKLNILVGIAAAVAVCLMLDKPGRAWAAKAAADKTAKTVESKKAA